CNCSSVGSRKASEIVALVMAINATTTSSSIRVNPAFRRPPGRTKTVLVRTAESTGLLPGADVGVAAFAAGAAVGAEAVDVDLTLHARVGVLVGVAPGVVGQLLEVRLPVRRRRARGGLVHQGVQALVTAGIALVVELVELEGLHQVVDV